MVGVAPPAGKRPAVIACALAMADLADHAFGHALAVVGDERVAAAAARRGLHRGGRSRVAALGHTRAAALASEGLAVGGADTPPASVTDAAIALAARRPAVERAVVDLEGARHGLTRAGFARALGLSPAAAGERAATVAGAWGADLDPALLAWLGPGDCEALAELLAASGAEADSLLALSPAVAAHAADCEACGDRLRAMVSVRSLLGQLPLPAAPPDVAAAGRAARRRPPVPPPPLGEERTGFLRRAGVAAAVVAFMAVAGVLAVRFVRNRDNARHDRVAALTALPSGRGALVLSASTFDATTHSLTIANRSAHRLRWDSSATVPWVRVTPSSGTLPPGGATVVDLRLLGSAPEGDINAIVTFTGADGSSATATGAGTIERAPDVAAHRAGCEVFASAEDEGRVAAVTVHWRTGGPGPAESSDEMQPVPGGGYHDGLPPTATVWWVTAADARGNVSHTPEEPVTPPAC
jgi:hypothetical protein